MQRILACGLMLACLIGVAAFEWTQWGWHPAREEPAGASAWHWLRAVVTMVLSAGVVATFMPSDGTETSPLSRTAIAAAWTILTIVAALTVLLALDPTAYHAIIVEDGPVEWGSALLLFFASFCALQWMRCTARGGSWRRIEPLAAAGFVALFFLMAMEEISWFQRVIGFDTPEAVAERNWQGEFNLHNFQTDITELGLYAGTGVFLVLLPLLRETLEQVRPFDRLVRLFPDRTVAAISAPMLLLTYGHFNLLPVQAATWLGVAAMIAFALEARAGHRQAEATLFAALAVGIALGQAAYLAIGHRMIEIFDATEYREAILALGLALYGWRQWQASRPAPVTEDWPFARPASH